MLLIEPNYFVKFDVFDLVYEFREANYFIIKDISLEGVLTDTESISYMEQLLYYEKIGIE